MDLCLLFLKTINKEILVGINTNCRETKCKRTERGKKKNRPLKIKHLPEISKRMEEMKAYKKKEKKKKKKRERDQNTTDESRREKKKSKDK